MMESKQFIVPESHEYIYKMFRGENIKHSTVKKLSESWRDAEEYENAINEIIEFGYHTRDTKKSGIKTTSGNGNGYIRQALVRSEYYFETPVPENKDDVARMLEVIIIRIQAFCRDKGNRGLLETISKSIGATTDDVKEALFLYGKYYGLFYRRDTKPSRRITKRGSQSKSHKTEYIEFRPNDAIICSEIFHIDGMTYSEYVDYMEFVYDCDVNSLDNQRDEHYEMLTIEEDLESFNVRFEHAKLEFLELGLDDGYIEAMRKTYIDSIKNRHNIN